MEIGPGLVTLLGGAPGAGKTAFVMQLVVDAMVLTPSLRVLVCNVEMPWEVLLSRQLARFSGIDLRTIRYRQFRAEHQWRLEHGFDRIEHVANRLAFLQPPFEMGRILRAAKDFRADLIVFWITSNELLRLGSQATDAEKLMRTWRQSGNLLAMARR